MGPSEEGGEGFVVEEPEPSIYNPTGAEPAVWQPNPQDILLMFQQLESEEVLPLKWVCPGRRPPEKEPPEQPSDYMSGGEDDDDEKEEEKRVPEPSAFDFDDTASEASAKVKMTPRTPVSAQAKRPEKKMACMDNVLKSIKRQQKAEREARKSQARTMGTSPFRANTPSRLAGFSPTPSPRLPAVTVSPGPGSPRVAAPTGSPSPRMSASGEGASSKQGLPGSPSMTGNKGTVSPSATPGPAVTTTATSPPKPVVSEAPPSISVLGSGAVSVSVAATSSTSSSTVTSATETVPSKVDNNGGGNGGDVSDTHVAMETDQGATDAAKST